MMKEFGKSVNEMDVEAFSNLRDWLDKALTDAGAEITYGGIGVGRADTAFNLNGMPYEVSIRPKPIR